MLTGLRKNDILNLKWQDVDLEKGILYFFEHKKGQRKIKILCQDMINVLRELPRDGSEYIFHDRKGNRLRQVTPFGRLCKRSGIQDFHFHDLRYTSASYMVMRGASLKAVQEHLGHTTLMMTQKYAHLRPEFQKAEVDRLNGVFLNHIPAKKEIDLENENIMAGNA